MTERREPGFGPDLHQPRLELDTRDNVRSAGVSKRRLPPLPIVAMILLLLAGVAYALLGHVGQTHVTESGIPVILADPTPVRVRPEQPGGMEIPFQDTTVYDELAAGKKHAPGTVEHLLAAPEQPLPKPEVPAAPAENARPMPEADATSPAAPVVVPPQSDNDAVLAPQITQPVVAPVPVEPVPKLLLPPPPAAPVKHVLPKPAADEDADSDDQPVAKAPKPSKTLGITGQSEIQLGAYKEASVAETEWQKLEASHGDELGSLSHHVERADLGDKGIWYRLKAGPLDDAHARQDCATLKSDGLTCFVPSK